jgi:YHS domain-containing protein
MRALAKPLCATSLPILAGVFLGLLLALAAQVRPASADGAVNSSYLRGVAIEGTDPVAYFNEGRPVEGSSEHEHEHEWMGAVWRFASAENRDAFAAAPERYAPQYGGWCAWAVAHGYTARIDPEAWKIVDGRLYLNYSKDVQAQWSADIPGYIAKGDANWPTIRADLAD